MARRSGVPYYEWVTAFTIYNSAVAKAVKDIEKRYGLMQDIIGRGNVLRLALAKVAVKRLHQLLAQNPGIENPDQIAQFVIQAVESVTPEELAAALKQVAPNLPPEKQAEVMKAFEILKKILPNYVQSALAMARQRIQAMYATAPA